MFPVKSKSSLSGRKYVQTCSSMYDSGELKGFTLRRRQTQPFEIDFTSRMAKYIVLPNSRRRFAWDMLGLCFLLYDLVETPFAVCFTMPRWAAQGLSPAMALLIAVFWTLDIIFNFFVGYVHKGINIMMPGRIARHYITTWFPMDATLVVLDWGTLIATAFLDREFDAVRVLILIRVARWWRMSTQIEEHIQSEVMEVLVDVVKLLTFVLLISHVIACMWYAIGETTLTNDWVTANGLDESSLEYKYSTAMHWALSKMFLESMDVFPQNFPERRFAVSTQIVGLVVFSSTISRITSSMIQLQSLRDHSSKQFWLLRRYLHERQVDPLLSSRIQRYLKYMVQERLNYVQTSSITILSLLSKQLKDELNYAITVPHFQCHPLFAHIANVSDVIMFRLLGRAISQFSLARDDSLFFAGEQSSTFFLVLAGRLQYIEDVAVDGERRESGKSKGSAHMGVREPTAGSRTSTRTRTKSTIVRSSIDLGDAAVSSSPLARSMKSRPRQVVTCDWMCEQCLWTTWVHVGDLHAMTECHLLCVGAESFGAVMQGNLSAWKTSANYCTQFLVALNAMSPDELCDLGGGEKEHDVLAGFIDNYRGGAGGRAVRPAPSRAFSLPLFETGDGSPRLVQ